MCKFANFWMITESRAAVQDRYVILKELPSGLLGPTMLVKPKETQDYLVCKVCHKSSIGSAAKLQSFKDRIERLRSLSLPFIVPYKDMIENDKDLFLIRDYVDETSLTDYVESTTTIPDATIMQVWKGLVANFLQLHRNGVFPSSIRPNNVFLRDNSLLITDLYEVSSEVEWALQTPDAMHLAFLAPEFFDPAAAPSSAADVWSLGLMLAYMKFHVLPWPTKNIFSMIKAITDKNFLLRMNADNDVEATIMVTVVRDEAKRMKLEQCTDLALIKRTCRKGTRRGSVPGSGVANKMRESARKLIHSGSMFCPNKLFLAELNSQAARSTTFDDSLMPTYTVRCRFLKPGHHEPGSD